MAPVGRSHPNRRRFAVALDIARRSAFAADAAIDSRRTPGDNVDMADPSPAQPSGRRGDIQPWRWAELLARQLDVPGSVVQRALAALLILAIAGSAAVLLTSAACTPADIAADVHARALGLPIQPCPGCSLCGMSRAFSALTHLQLREAFSFHPGVLLCYPLPWLLLMLGPGIAVRAWRASSGPPSPPPTRSHP